MSRFHFASPPKRVNVKTAPEPPKPAAAPPANLGLSQIGKPAPSQAKTDTAKIIVHEAGIAIARWRETAAAVGLAPAAEIERMASAFELADAEQG